MQNEIRSQSERPDLESQRLLLRYPDGRDVAAIVDGVGDLQVARQLARIPHPYGPADAAFFLTHVVPHECVWAITLRGDDTLIGLVGLTPGETDTAELGYWLSRAHWGRGFAGEAARAVVDHGFATRGLSVITAGHFAENVASARVLDKLGFAVTGASLRHCLALQRDVASVELRLPRPK